MNFLQKTIGIRRYALIRRHFFCPLGMHGPRLAPDGSSGNVCCWGCGLVFNPNMWKSYVVTLKDGQQYKVVATNEFHAGSLVVYGETKGERFAIDGRTGKVLMGDVKVHRENIESIRLDA